MPTPFQISLPPPDAALSPRSPRRDQASSSSARHRALDVLSQEALRLRLHHIAASFERARVTLELTEDLTAHRHLATTCEAIAADLLETACAYLGWPLFQAILDAEVAVEERLFDPDDERYLV